MIMMKKDNTYKQVGFKKIRQADGSYKDVEFQYSKDSNGDYKLTFEKGFTREIEGVLPLSLNGIGKDLKDYDIYGNTYQSDGVSPDTPQEVKGCGDRTRNLFSGTINSYNLDSTGKLEANEIYKLYIAEVAEGATYTVRITKGTTVSVYGFFSEYPKTNSVTIDNSRIIFYADEHTFTAPAGAKYVAVRELSTTENAMLNSGSTPLPYEPYGYKVDVECRGKNLFDESKQASDIYVTESVTRYGVEIPVKAGVYTIAGGTNKLFVKEKYGTTYGTAIDTSAQRVITLPQNGYLLIYAARSEDYTVSNIMLNTGTTPEPYEPYTPPITTPIYLDSPLYKIGDYADVRGMTEEVRAVKELVLTGEEVWTLQSINSNGIANFFITSTKTHAIAINLICTHFVSQKTTIADTTTEGIYNSVGNAIYIRLKQERANTVADFKSYLAAQYANGTPVIVYYVLAEPETKTVEPVEVPTLDGTTIIEAETEIEPSNVYLKYKSSK